MNVNLTRLAIISIIVIIPLCIVFVFVNGTSPQSPNYNTNHKLKVISSFYPIHEFVQNIGQDKIEAILLVPTGIEPHGWEPTIKDTYKIQTFDLIVINGMGFEGWINNLEEIGYSGTIIDTSIGVSAVSNHDYPNSHIWLNPVFAQIQVQNIADALSVADPENKEYYKSNAIKFINELIMLDAKIKDELSECSNDIITFHDAFSYFADQYGLNQYSIVSSDSHDEPRAKTIIDVILLAKKLNINVIFGEEAANIKILQTIANEINAQVLILSPLEIGSNKSYITRMTENLDNLKVALC